MSKSTNNSGNNGRVDVLHFQNLNHYNLFKETNNNNNDSFVKHTLCEHPVSNMFFSKENIDILQNGIRYSVFKKSNDVIDNQSLVELQIIMRSMYFQYSRNLPNDIVPQVKELNTKVLEFIVPRIVVELTQYASYTNDISKLPIPLERSKLDTMKGTKFLHMEQF